MAVENKKPMTVTTDVDPLQGVTKVEGPPSLHTRTVSMTFDDGVVLDDLKAFEKACFALGRYPSSTRRDDLLKTSRTSSMLTQVDEES